MILDFKVRVLGVDQGAHTSGYDLWRPRIFECINYGMVYEMGFVTYPFK